MTLRIGREILRLDVAITGADVFQIGEQEKRVSCSSPSNHVRRVTSMATYKATSYISDRFVRKPLKTDIRDKGTRFLSILFGAVSKSLCKFVYI